MRIDEARGALRSRGDLNRCGVGDRALAAAVRAQSLVRVDRGFYVPRSLWDAGFSEGRHLLRVVAADARRRDGSAVFAFTSATAAHGLPLFRVEPRRVHVSGARVDGRAVHGDPLVARHEMPVADDDIVVIDGLRCTSLARTVADMARSASSETALALADAALRRIAWSDTAHTYDRTAADDFCEQVRRHLPRGGRGVRAARRIVDLADGRAELPGERTSRLYLIELGFASPELQTAVRAPGGGNYYVDLDLAEVQAWGEFDGEGKYLDAAKRAGSTLEEVLLAEKKREDWIRGTTNRRFARWGMAHIATAGTLGARLAEFQIFPP